MADAVVTNVISTEAGQVALNLDSDHAVKLAEATAKSFECFDMSIPSG